MGTSVGRINNTTSVKEAALLATAPVATKRLLSAPGDAKLFSGDALRARSTGTPSVHPQLRTRGPFVLPTPNETPIGKAFDALPIQSVEAKVRLLTDNKESWLSVWHTLKSADKVLDATYFIFNRDVFGSAFLGKMLQKQRSGTKTRLLLDASGDSFGRKGYTQTWRGQDYLQALVGAGGDVRVYHPLHKKIPKQIMSGDPMMAISVNHDKLVRTERYAVTGGRNISHDYFVSPTDRNDVYRDTDVLVEGKQASQQLEKAFAMEFDRKDLCYQVTADQLGDLRDRDGEMIGAAFLMEAWTEGPALNDAKKNILRTDAGAKKTAARELVDGVLERLSSEKIEAPGFFGKRRLTKLAEELVGYTELAGAYASYDPNANMRGPTAMKVLDRTSLGAAGPDTIAPSLKAMAAAAKDRLVLTNPYVVVTDEMLDILESAGKRGVKIDILTNSPDSSDSMLTQAFFMADWPKLMARVPNLRLFVFTGDQKLHAKTMMADDEIGAVGSYNMDLLSSKVNGELMMATKSRALSRDLGAAFARDVANPLQEVHEYTIERNANGTPKLVDGKPVIAHGPHDHMTKWDGMKYSVLSWLATIAKKLPMLEPLALER